MNKTVHSVGIDVSKKTLDVCFLNNKLVPLKTFKIQNSTTAIQKFIRTLKQFSVTKKTPIIIESTGDYHLLVCLLLNENSFNVFEINPIIYSKFIKSSIRKIKTDKADAIALAQIGFLHADSLHPFNRSRKSVLLRKKIIHLNSLQKQKQQLVLSEKNYSETLENLGCIHSNNNFKEMIVSINKLIDTLKKEIKNESPECYPNNHLAEIKGISALSAGIILSFIDNRNFKSKQALIAYAGLDISTKLSGTSIHGKGKLSKRGNSTFRKTLTQSAWGLRMHNPQFKKLSQYYEKQNKHYFEIMIILARKLLKIIYGMNKTNSHFNPTKFHLPS